MAWAKDTTSDPPRIIYTPGASDTPDGLTRVVYDPDAPVSRRLCAEFAYILYSDETINDLDLAWNI